MTTTLPLLRSRARHLALDAASAGRRLAHRDRSALARPRVHFPYFHAVPRSEESGFRALVEALAERHVFVSYDEGVRRVLHGPIDRAYVSFSFDDGFASNLRAARILEEYGASGCFFVPTGFIGSSLDPTQTRAFFGSAWLTEPAMTWNDLEELKERGHAIENHTVNHPVLSQVSEQQAVDEIFGAADELRRRLGSSTHFAWPRGRFSHFTPAAARAVFDSGHLSCASAERGAHTTVHLGDRRGLCLRREHETTEWPLRHAMYFVARSSDRALRSPGAGWPDGWQVER